MVGCFMLRHWRSSYHGCHKRGFGVELIMDSSAASRLELTFELSTRW